MIASRLGQACVVGYEGVEIGSDSESRRQMDRVQGRSVGGSSYFRKSFNALRTSSMIGSMRGSSSRAKALAYGWWVWNTAAALLGSAPDGIAGHRSRRSE